MSIYKNFRDYSQKYVDNNILSSKYDQPSYLSFKLEFAPDRDVWYNNDANYDKMPHPLFAKSVIDGAEKTYSAIDYLLDANEFTRARMLEEFILKFNTLQTEFQWYFQKIEGVSDLLKIDPKKGMRITSDKRLTISTLEGLDLRMSYLMNMYRKIAWDDTYQRWVLPDMMRYFTLKIYVTEFRTFHVPTKQNDELFLNVMDGIMPTWVINCEMCEFDIENIEFTHLSNLSVGEDPTEAALRFGIKVGKIYEEQIYPSFKNMYLIDKALNGFSRIQDSDVPGYDPLTKSWPSDKDVKFNSTLASQNNNSTKFKDYQKIGQNLGNNPDSHLSGTPFNQMTNSKSLFGAKGAGPDGSYFTEDDKYSPQPTKPETWLGNALDFGTAFATNFVEEKIDKAKITPIPGLGFSFTEVAGALQSKNIVTALGLIRKSVNQVTRDHVMPSDLLNKKPETSIAEETFRLFLEGVSQSTATSELNQLMVEAANLALTDSGTWEKIKDFSLATNLVGEGEKNIDKTIYSKTDYQVLTNDQSNNDRSTATDLDGGPKPIITGSIIESTPSSKATSNQILKG